MYKINCGPLFRKLDQPLKVEKPAYCKMLQTCLESVVFESFKNLLAV